MILKATYRHFQFTMTNKLKVTFNEMASEQLLKEGNHFTIFTTLMKSTKIPLNLEKNMFSKI